MDVIPAMQLLALKSLRSTRIGRWFLVAYALYIALVIFAGISMWLEGDHLKQTGGPALSAYEIADGFFFRDLGAPLSRLFFHLDIKAAPENSWLVLPLLTILVLVQAYVWMLIANLVIAVLLGRKNRRDNPN